MGYNRISAENLDIGTAQIEKVYEYWKGLLEKMAF
jgi:hypothetical protein